MKKFVLLLILAFTTFFSSCEKDLYEEALQTNDKVKIEEKSFSDLLNNQFFNRSVNKIISQTIKDSINNNKTPLEELYNFTIIQEAPVKVITNNDGSVSYIIMIEREVKEELILENLVLNLNQNDEKTFLVKYFLEQEPTKCIADDSYDMKIDNTQITAISDSSHKDGEIGCDVVLCFCNNDGFGGYASSYHIAGPECTSQSHLVYVTIGSSSTSSTTPTSSSTINNDTSTTSSSTTTSGNTGGVNTNTSSSAPIVVVPNYSSLDQQFINSLGSVREVYFNALSNVVKQQIIDYLSLMDDFGNNTQLSNLQNQRKARVKTALMQINLAWISQQPAEMQISIFNYLIQNNFNAENVSFVIPAVNQMVQNPGLNINLEASANSPAFIDTSLVMGNTPEEIKFREVYNILQQSSNFQNLFTNLFGVTNFINIKFKIENINQQGVAGNCQLFSYAFGGLTNEITINRENLLTNSNVNIATAIIHECIHAFLNIKLRHPNIGMSINNINNLNLQDCINTYYNGFSGDQSQHDFYVDFLIPTISSILNEIKDELFTSQQISIAENPLYSNQYIFGVNPTIPATYNEQVLPWSWEDFFYYQSQVGLQNCTAFNILNPLNSANYLNFIQYYHTGTLIFAP